MANIVELSLTKEDYLEIARAASLEGQVEKAIINLNKALRLDNKFLDATLALSNLYLSLHDISLADGAIFKTLQYLNKEDEINRCYNQLALNHIEIKDIRTAEYYLIKCNGDFTVPDLDYSDFEMPEEKKEYTLYEKDGEEENSTLIEKAYEALRERRYEDVILCADRVSEKSKHKHTADYLVLITLMLKENFQGVIDNGKMIVEKRGETLQILSTIATAYWLMDQKEEAYKVVDRILEKQYTKDEDILQLLPLLVNTSMHVHVVQYAKLALSKTPFQKDIMMWCAQGLYNIGQVAESKRLFGAIFNVFGYEPARYYLEEIEHKPISLEYSIMLPQSEKIRRLQMIKDLLKGSAKKIQSPINDEEIIKTLDWIIEDNNLSYLRASEVLYRNLPVPVKDEIVRKHMLDYEMSFEKIISLFTLLIEPNVFNYDFNIVAQERYKHIRLILPKTYFVLPLPTKTAVTIAISEIIQADEQADEFVQILIDGLDKVFSIENDDILPKHCTPLQLKRAKSIETLVGAMIAYTYKGEAEQFGVENPGDFAKKHGLDEKKFDKYYSMIYGEKYDY